MAVSCRLPGVSCQSGVANICGLLGLDALPGGYHAEYAHEST